MWCEIIFRFLVVNYCCNALHLRCLQESWIGNLHRFYFGNESLFFSVGLALHMILRINLQLAKNDSCCCYIFIFLMLCCCYVWVVCCCVVLCVVVLLSCCLVNEIFLLSREEFAGRCSVNKLSWQISQNSQENTCLESFL